MGSGEAESIGSVDDRELEEIRRRKLQKLFREVKYEGGGELSVRIVIPVEEAGLDARLAMHFGRAPYFTVIELSPDGRVLNQQTIPNESEHFGGVGRPPDRILSLKPDVVVTYGMGPRALSIFQAAGVAVLRADAETVREVIEAYMEDRLQELTEGCHHARHP